MILSHTHKFIFICNGKTGTTSIEKALEKYQEGSEFEIEAPGLFQGRHIPPGALREILGPSIWDSYFKFCFVRNTWDWFISQVFHNCKGHIYNQSRPSKRDLITNPALYLQKRKTYQEQTAALWGTKQISEEQIMLTYELLKPFRAIYSEDCLFQRNYVYGSSGEKLVDFVGSFENLSEDFQTILEKINLDSEIKLPVLNKNPHKRYQEYYTDKTKEIVGELFQVDIQEFHFKF